MTKKRWLLVTGGAIAALVLSTTAVFAGGGEGRGEPAAGEAEGGSAEVAETHIASCTAISKLSYAQSTTPSSTVNTSFVDIPGAAVSFSTASTGCVAVDFAAEAFAGANGLMFVRATLDGRACPLSEDWQFSGDDDEDSDGRYARAHAYNCVFNPVAAGNHVVRMQYRSFSGTSVAINDLGLQVHSRA